MQDEMPKMKNCSKVGAGHIDRNTFFSREFFRCFSGSMIYSYRTTWRGPPDASEEKHWLDRSGVDQCYHRHPPGEDGG